ncbi:MAG: hypothetical protein ACRD2H_05990 [Terriglobales bacterium]
MAATCGVPRAERAAGLTAAVRRACIAAWRAVAARWGATLLLTGSLAAGEGAWRREAARWRLLGDIDLLIAWPDWRPLPRSGAMAEFTRAIERRLAAEGIFAVAPAHAGHARALRRLPASIWLHDLRAHAQVLAGPGEVAQLLPACPAAAIPAEDGWRLLNNRMAELLETQAAGGVADDYRLVRLQLAMGAAALVGAGRYTSGARAQTAALRRWAAEPGSPPAVSELAAMAERALAAKFGGVSPCSWPRTQPLLYRVWRWQLERLAAAAKVEASEAGDAELLRALAAKRPLRQRLRAWAALARRTPLGEWQRHRPAAIGASAATPRDRVYAAAAQLLFAPTATQAEDSMAWRRAAADTAWAYHRWVEPTRA